jgi:hypothetical protein
MNNSHHYLINVSDIEKFRIFSSIVQLVINGFELVHPQVHAGNFFVKIVAVILL